MTGKQTLLLAGTRKGLWVGTSDGARASWEWRDPAFLMNEVYACLIDTRSERPRLLVGAMSSHFGPQVFRSDDLGASWEETPNGAIRFPEDTGAALEQVWQLTTGSDKESDVVYAGTQPSALFRSEDRGETFSMVRGLWDHPHRPEWGPGYGGQAIHTVLPHPSDPSRVTVAMSTGGVYRTYDGGKTWSAANKGIKAPYMPDPWPEFGQCVHKVARHADRPDRLYAQNHHGVYRSDDAGDTWVSIADGLPTDFGFTMVVHAHDPDTIYVFPIVADSERIPPEGKARVWRSRDAGQTWQELGGGDLPDGFFSAVMRDAMCTDGADPLGVYVGARNGTIFASADEGDSWTEIAQNLPDVMVVRAAQV